MMPATLPKIQVVATVLSLCAASTTAVSLFPNIALANQTTSTGNVPCDALVDAGLGSLLLLPTDTGYEPRIEAGWWSASTWLHPWCIVQPTSTREVSQIVQALGQAERGEWHVAVRGGGHNQWPSNNIDNGVTIDLGMMNQTTYNSSNTLASIGPGGTWGASYKALTPYNLTVVGGRVADVGISGFLLGGGDSYYSGRYGFGCDNVVNFEVVLPNGTIVDANNATNSDLHKALKGGGSNFGIVTRFDLKTIPYTDLYAGFLSWDLSHTASIVTAFTDFTDAAESTPDDQLVTLFLFNNETSTEITTFSSLVNSQANTSTTSFEELFSIPAESGSMDLISLYDYTVASENPAGQLNLWWTLTYVNDAIITQKALDLYTDLVDTLKDVLGPGAFNTYLVFQPIPSYYAGLGEDNGGNVLGLSGAANGVLVLVEVNVETEANKAVGHAYGSVMMTKLDEYAASLEGSYPWRYLNYADPSQDPLGSYGSSSVEFIRSVAEKYDPAGTFQSLFSKGFKISRVD